MRSCLAAVILLLTSSVSPAADGPLRFVPREADVAVAVEQPRAVIDAVRSFEPFRQLFQFEAIREQLESTNANRLAQLIAYYEKELGVAAPDLLDRLAGGGVALATRFQDGVPPVLLVACARDEALLHRAFDLLLATVRTEQERTESPMMVKSAEYRGFTGYQLGKDAFAAVAGPVLFASNKAEGVQAGLDLYINGSGESLARTGQPDEAKALLPSNPLAWTYVRLDKLHRQAAAQQAYKYPKGDPGQLILFQGVTDVLGKAPFLAVGQYASGDGFRTAIRMPAGRSATPDGLGLHLAGAGRPGSLPLLEPKNVLFSMSFHLDLGKLWTDRERLLTEGGRRAIEGADKQLGRFLGGKKLADMLTAVGPYHRLVVAAQDETGYRVRPDQIQPASAFVSDMRSPAYAEGMNAILRTAALVLGAQAKLKMSEEKIGDVTLVTYRFPEDGSLPADRGNVRFNFSPCFARVGNQFVIASSAPFARELVGILQSEPAGGSPRSTQMRVYSAGGAALLKAFEDQLLTQTILDRAVGAEQAKKEAAAFVDWLRSLGRLEIDTEYGADEYRTDIRWRWKNHGPRNVSGSP